MNIATLNTLFAKQSGTNPFIAEKREDIIWVSDAKGTFEFETTITDDNWHPIEFDFAGKTYEADLNIHEADGEVRLAIHAFKTNDQGNVVTDGENFIVVTVKQ